MLFPADKAINSIIVICRLHFINTSKQEQNISKAYKETSTDKETFNNSHLNDMPDKIALNDKERQIKI